MVCSGLRIKYATPPITTMPVTARIAQLVAASPPAPVLGTPGVAVVLTVPVVVVLAVPEVSVVCAEAIAPVVRNAIAVKAIAMCFLIDIGFWVYLIIQTCILTINKVR